MFPKTKQTRMPSVIAHIDSPMAGNLWQLNHFTQNVIGRPRAFANMRLLPPQLITKREIAFARHPDFARFSPLFPLRHCAPHDLRPHRTAFRRPERRSRENIRISKPNGDEHGLETPNLSFCIGINLADPAVQIRAE